ncbi:MAG: hypothetical protein RIR10_677 [Planctomycetota bacterium]
MLGVLPLFHVPLLHVFPFHVFPFHEFVSVPLVPGKFDEVLPNQPLFQLVNGVFMGALNQGFVAANWLQALNQFHALLFHALLFHAFIHGVLPPLKFGNVFPLLNHVPVQGVFQPLKKVFGAKPLKPFQPWKLLNVFEFHGVFQPLKPPLKLLK